eukprot:6122449-Amphidinium_carterae.4
MGAIENVNKEICGLVRVYRLMLRQSKGGDQCELAGDAMDGEACRMGDLTLSHTCRWLHCPQMAQGPGLQRADRLLRRRGVVQDTRDTSPW